jgi:hypothetical protein
MIQNIADLLKKIVDREREVLDEYKLIHGPTIGSMYEGLTREILDKSIPEDLGLQIVGGFAFFADELSGEIDCMVVRGTGEEIPYTGKHKWHIRDVIAVFEVKKSISANEIADSHDHLRELSRLYSNYVESEEASDITVDLAHPRRVFSQITRQIAPAHSDVDHLPFDLKLLYHTLVTEFIWPIRIVVGYHGWKKEETLRNHIAKLVMNRLGSPIGMGAGSFPQLIICGQYSLIKMNGFPYLSPLRDGRWLVLASTSYNPLKLLLEILFTRIDLLYSTSLAIDDPNEQEAMTPCLYAQGVQQDGVQGWIYQYLDVPNKKLQERGASLQWHPPELTHAQLTIIGKLCKGDEISTCDPEFVQIASQVAGGVDAFLRSLLETDLIAVDNQYLRLTTVNCLIAYTSSGKWIAGENNTGQMEAWLNRDHPSPKTG